MIGTIASVGDRGFSFRLSVLFLLATAVGSAGLGASSAMLGSRLVIDITEDSRLALLLIATVTALLIDLRLLRIPLPYLHRQVSRLDWSRGHARAAMRWGLELGVGVVTFVPSAGFFVLIAYAFFDASPAAVLPLLAFGLARGGQPAIALFWSETTTRWVSIRSATAALAAVAPVLLGTFLAGGGI
jgi:hypothetical protein